VKQGNVLRLFENRVLRGIFVRKRDEITENYIMRSLMISTLQQITFW